MEDTGEGTRVVDDSDQGIVSKLQILGLSDEELLVAAKKECEYDSQMEDGEPREYYAADVDGDCAAHSQLIATIMEIDGK
jgi:hypothetical protein